MLKLYRLFLTMILAHVPNYLESRCHYSDVIMSLIVSEITSLTIIYSTVYLGADFWSSINMILNILLPQAIAYCPKQSDIYMGLLYEFYT